MGYRTRRGRCPGVQHAAPAHRSVACASVRTPVGVAPVGIQPFDNDRLIAVADSNRFTTGQAGSVSILDYRLALQGAGTAATVGTFEAGDFPRQWGLSNNDHFLYLTEFSSNVLAILPVASLVDDVRALDPDLGFGSPFAAFTTRFGFGRFAS
jgi:hypothetical protein